MVCPSSLSDFAQQLSKAYLSESEEIQLEKKRQRLSKVHASRLITKDEKE